MYTAVIIDDNPWAISDIRQTFAFEKRGFEVMGEFGSAEAALPALLENPPDLILTDIRMENMNGLELSATLRDKGVKSMIVLISGYEQFDYARQALRCDVFDYLLKPIDDAAVEDLMLRVIKRLGENEDAAGPNGPKNSSLEAALSYIEKHYAQDITLGELADCIYINKNYLSELFSKKLGVTFTQYKNSVKIRHACELLDAGNRNMTEIAMTVGFDSGSRFSKVFRQHMGMKPQEYQKRRK